MKIAIISPFATVNPHFEMELELAQQHLDAGDHVEYFSCTGQLFNCDFNTFKDIQKCQECELRRTMGLQLLSEPVENLPLVTLENAEPSLQLRFENVAQLIAYRIDDFDIGYAALSSLVSVVRDPEPDLTEHGPLLERFLKSAWQTYRFTRDLLQRKSYDRVYCFNGRFAAMRGVLRGCEAERVDCFLHERGCGKDHYELFQNHLPHDITAINRTIKRLWDAADPTTREAIGGQWYLDRVNRVETAWKSFVTGQEQGSLPTGFSQDKKNIALFCSSDDEFVAIGDCWANELYPNQVTAIEQIATSLIKSHRDFHLWVRVHPNLIGVENQRKQDMLALSFPNVTIIAPDDKIDTYALMKAADVTASFGSSVGIEAVFWDRPSVLLGPCLYQHLEGPIRSESHQHTIELLTSHRTPPQKAGALQYGFWFQTRGYRYKYYSADTLFEGKFKGQLVYPKPKPKPSRLKKLKQTLRQAIAEKG